MRRDGRRDPTIARFVQADSIVPDGVQGYDRYAYASNNPSSNIDPSGHKPCWATAHYSCDKRDVTDWLARALTDSASSDEIEFVASYLFGEGSKTEGGAFAGWGMYFQLVRPWGKYDVKLKIADELGDVVKIGDKWYENSTPGNILFGNYSHAAGFSLLEIQKGAEYTARPDNWSYVAAGAGAYATYGLGAAFLARASTAASNGVPVTP